MKYNFKRETYINESGVKLYAEYKLEFGTVHTTIVFTDESFQTIEFGTEYGFHGFLKDNDFEQIKID